MLDIIIDHLKQLVDGVRTRLQSAKLSFDQEKVFLL